MWFGRCLYCIILNISIMVSHQKKIETHFDDKLVINKKKFNYQILSIHKIKL